MYAAQPIAKNHQKTAIVGPNGCGKSTIVDALSLVLGKSRMVRNLAEHDFTGSCPTPSDRLAVPTLVDLAMFASPSSRYTTLPSG
jgi:energy-coupling factor transporter ATP-binding protein EcfA2